MVDLTKEEPIFKKLEVGMKLAMMQAEGVEEDRILAIDGLRKLVFTCNGYVIGINPDGELIDTPDRKVTECSIDPDFILEKLPELARLGGGDKVLESYYSE